MEGADSGEHFVEHGAERKNIGAWIDRLSANLLRRHIARRPHHHPCRGVRTRQSNFVRIRPHLLRQLRQPEVENLDPAILGNENILRFQVAMNDPLFVGRSQSLSDLHPVLDGLALWQSAAIERRPQALAF